jgi:photosystem II stability/assembly factor-like uncharacterized protein
MSRLAFPLGLFLAALTNAQGQWRIQESHTNAGLRGIHSIGNGIAWASGSGGTVLRTTDGGGNWQTCTVPPGAEKLDFRGIQAFDRNSAIVLSSGKGDLSRLYKTTDGCRTWRLILTNPDPEGFWDAVRFTSGVGLLCGDPVEGKFVEFTTSDFGEHWLRSSQVPSAREGESLFAASNSSLLFLHAGGNALIVTGGTSGSRSIAEIAGGDIPLAVSESAGAFSVATAPTILVAVGGDYRKPDISAGTAAFSADGGQHWTAATTPPHGYRSSVAYDSPRKTWIAAGPNGTDISTDDGRNWRPLGTDRNWNALSLPFVVGSNGRIGKQFRRAPKPPERAAAGKIARPTWP